MVWHKTKLKAAHCSRVECNNIMQKIELFGVSKVWDTIELHDDEDAEMVCDELNDELRKDKTIACSWHPVSFAPIGYPNGWHHDGRGNCYEDFEQMIGE